ncbi:carboxylesterase family protein [Mycobacteroides abscessus subsp. abscessus]|uniref:carboxylesterase family protein n=2 Tax=Mycobacteroides abscessus TaxID=36809 RepID=UPI00266D72C1|nr:carboxylesterase family protein [Mycobacteroides abscessus]MDO3339882.1 carboxylesterase family protein [Mycobacteroides abscessus subsp. abscessus]
MIRTGAIRYATANRFEPPRPVTDDRRSSGAICPQSPSRLEGVLGVPDPRLPQSEDCLNLSIVTPGCDDARRPVMVWLHGGAFVSGGGLQSWYDGARLSAEQNVVVVSVNYRLGAFGFLYLAGVSPGNLGLLDQVEALRWVRRHIADYGGDPANVTVFGQSAGGLSTALLLGIPEARGLFHRAIMQSAPLISTHRPAQAEKFGRELVAQLGADPRSVAPDALLRATGKAVMSRTRTPVFIPFAPVVGVYPVSAEPFMVNGGGRDVMYGWTRDEVTAFGASLRIAPGLSKVIFGRRTRRFRDQLVAKGSRVFSYRIDWRPSGSPFGATHCVELPLLLGDRESWSAAPVLGDVGWGEVDRFGRAVRAAWASFARNGTPDTAQLAGWPITVRSSK